VLDMKLMRKHQRQHFAMEFLEALYHDNRDPLLVVFDEAAQFAPQQMREGGDVPRLLGAVEDLVKLGRSRGLGAVMIEQRIATLNANVREQIETLVAHRLVGPLDRKALKEWIEAQGEPERERRRSRRSRSSTRAPRSCGAPSFLTSSARST
jgi:DNA helicase HerA-like ATPase